MLKSILKFILYGGAAVCGLIGFGTAYSLLPSLNEEAAGYWYTLALLAIYICLAFTPGVLILTGWKTKKWHWASIAIVEAIVIAMALYAQLAIATL